jgi:hypothetical protein
MAVAVIQRIAAALLSPLPVYWPLHSFEPLVVTAMLVTAAVGVFPVVSQEAVDPIRTYRRISLGVLILSSAPTIALSLSSPPAPAPSLWPLVGVFIVIHVVAWAVTVEMLTLLATDRHPPAAEV